MGAFLWRHRRRARLNTAAALIFKSPEMAALLDYRVLQASRSGVAVHSMYIACLCCLRKFNDSTSSAHVCTCHAWGALMYRLN